MGVQLKPLVFICDAMVISNAEIESRSRNEPGRVVWVFGSCGAQREAPPTATIHRTLESGDQHQIDSLVCFSNFFIFVLAVSDFSALTTAYTPIIWAKLEKLLNFNQYTR
jgi:hypothetical protein